jgi:hypothetical protein
MLLFQARTSCWMECAERAPSIGAISLNYVGVRYRHINQQKPANERAAIWGALSLRTFGPSVGSVRSCSCCRLQQSLQALTTRLFSG